MRGVDEEEEGGFGKEARVDEVSDMEDVVDAEERFEDVSEAGVLVTTGEERGARGDLEVAIGGGVAPSPDEGEDVAGLIVGTNEGK